MALFQTKRDAAEVAEKKGGSKFINQPGIYDLNVIAAWADQGNGDSVVINFFVDHEGQQQPLYGNLRIINNDGSENKIGATTFNKLLVIIDEDEATDPEEATLPIGKEGADKDVAVIPNLTDFNIKMWIAVEYSVWDGSIQEKKVIRNFYRTSDGATAEEIVNEVENPGEQYAKDVEYLQSSENKGYIYKNDLTKEQIEQWIKDGRPKGTVSGSKPATKKPQFGKKRFNSK